MLYSVSCKFYRGLLQYLEFYGGNENGRFMSGFVVKGDMGWKYSKKERIFELLKSSSL